MISHCWQILYIFLAPPHHDVGICQWAMISTSSHDYLAIITMWVALICWLSSWSCRDQCFLEKVCSIHKAGPTDRCRKLSWKILQLYNGFPQKIYWNVKLRVTSHTFWVWMLWKSNAHVAPYTFSVQNHNTLHVLSTFVAAFKFLWKELNNELLPAHLRNNDATVLVLVHCSSYSNISIFSQSTHLLGSNLTHRITFLLRMWNVEVVLAKRKSLHFSCKIAPGSIQLWIIHSGGHAHLILQQQPLAGGGVY